MTRSLKIIFSVFLLTIVSVTLWASSEVALWDTPHAVVTHPWFIATLTDTYLAFLTIWLWIAYREQSVVASGFWLVLILLTGNMAIAGYLLLQLWRLPANAGIEQLLLRRP